MPEFLFLSWTDYYFSSIFLIFLRLLQLNAF